MLRVGAGPSEMTALQRARPGMPVRPLDAREQLAHVDAVLGLRAPRRIAELRRRQNRGDVQQGALGRGHRDALVVRDVAPVQRARVVHAETLHATNARPEDRDLDQPLLPRQALEVSSGSEPAQVRRVGARENRGHEPSLEGQGRISDGVDASVHAMQAAVPDPSADGVPVEPAGVQLPCCDLPLLLGGLPSDADVGGCLVLIADSATGTRHPSGHGLIVDRIALRTLDAFATTCARNSGSPAQGRGFRWGQGWCRGAT